jgi:hypothetical protein
MTYIIHYDGYIHLDDSEDDDRKCVTDPIRFQRHGESTSETIHDDYSTALTQKKWLYRKRLKQSVFGPDSTFANTRGTLAIQ